MIVRLSLTQFLIAALAVWRITHLFWGEDGPGGIFIRLRHLAGQSFFGQLLDCFYCLSLWVAVPFAWLLGVTRLECVLLWFSLSGSAILLERVTSRRSYPPPVAQYVEAPSEYKKKEN